MPRVCLREYVLRTQEFEYKSDSLNLEIDFYEESEQ